jgi:hypothetical protein
MRRNHAAKQTVGCGCEKTELAYGPRSFANLCRASLFPGAIFNT